MTASFLAPHASRLIWPRRSLLSPSFFAFTRKISLNTAIDRGIRRSDRANERGQRDGRPHERPDTRRETDRSAPSSSRGGKRFREGSDSRRAAERSAPSKSWANKDGRLRGRTNPRRREAERASAESRDNGSRKRPKFEWTSRPDDGPSGWPRWRQKMNKRLAGRSRDSGDAPSRDSRTHAISPASHKSVKLTRPRDPINNDDDRTPDTQDLPSYPQKQPKIPLSVPYTTSASEFLYGTSVVMAALRSGRRRLYKLYIYEAENRMRPGRDREMEKLAQDAGVDVELVRGDWARLMDKMSAGRPHNGYVLEASPLPRLPVTALEPVPSPEGSGFVVALDRQSKEEQDINGSDPVIPHSGKVQRYPLVLMLDGILDPGNLGNILRSAYFFGVDAVAICARNSAPLSPVALKASAGSSEYIPLVSIGDPASFMESTSRNGWKFYAAVAPPAPVNPGSAHPPTTPPTPNTRYISTDKLRYPLAKQPCVLMVGGEGEGLRWSLRKKADQEVGIEGKPDRKDSVDSLNVSVAAGVLCEAFLRGDGLEGLKEEREREGEKLF